ncbi:hypothetical protein D3C77_115560 [compost metagenome]
MNWNEQIQRLAEQVFGDKANADAWLEKSSQVLGDITPRECVKSEVGYLQVKELLERIRHGFCA